VYITVAEMATMSAANRNHRAALVMWLTEVANGLAGSDYAVWLSISGISHTAPPRLTRGNSAGQRTALLTVAV
jgi:hypothetical protein